MPLPGNWTAVTLTNEYQIAGVPLQGHVTFTPTARTVNSGAGVVQPPGGRVAHLDPDGKISVALPVVDDPDVSPAGWAWRVLEELILPTGQRYSHTYDIQVTAAMAPEVKLSELAPVTAVAEVSPYLRAVDIGTTAGTVAAGDDARLTDSRTPASHAASHAAAGSDPVTPAAIGAVPTSRTVIAGTGLTGGGALTADRSLAVAYGTTAGTAAQGNDSRLAGAVQASLIDAKGDLIVGTASDTVTRLAVGADGLVPHADPATPEGIAWRVKDPAAYPSGVAAMDRLVAASNSAVWASGNLRLIYFTAPRSETWTAIAAVTGGTAAAPTPTLCRMGIYSVDGSGNLTLLGACANDTSLFAATSARYTRSLTASVNAVAGQRYAHGLLIVSAATMPSFRGSGTDAALSALTPRVAGTIGGQSDLPASIAAGSLGGVGVVHFGEVL